jgi:4-hydroxy-2-oxoheptanedioate aldolase
MTSSHLQQALACGKPVWGGWITGPTSIGPEEFARAGYDYVGFDAQHGYLDDADIAKILRRLEHVPIGTAVRLPSVDPAPIGRVLDAGADAIIVAMIESADQAAAAVAATRYPPAGMRSFGPLRASLGYNTAALEARVSVFAMIETASALTDVTELCSGLVISGFYVGTADLGFSCWLEVTNQTSHPAVRHAIVIIVRAAYAAGLVP